MRPFLQARNFLQQAEELNEVMSSALLGNRVDFIKLIMENGLSLKDFLTIKRMLQLYNNVSTQQHAQFEVTRKVAANDRCWKLWPLMSDGFSIQWPGETGTGTIVHL